MGKKDGGIQGKLRFRRTIAAKWEKRTAKSKENRILAVLSKQAAKTKNLTIQVCLADVSTFSAELYLQKNLNNN